MAMGWETSSALPLHPAQQVLLREHAALRRVGAAVALQAAQVRRHEGFALGCVGRTVLARWLALFFFFWIVRLGLEEGLEAMVLAGGSHAPSWSSGKEPRSGLR